MTNPLFKKGNFYPNVRAFLP